MLPKTKLLTFILGARCVDGVVLVADRKLTTSDGSPPTYQDKLFRPFEPVVWGATGTQAYYVSFVNRVQEKMSSRRSKRGVRWETFRRILDESYEAMGERYGQKFRYDLSVILAERQGRWAGLSLYQIDGTRQPIPDYVAEGSGSPYGAGLLRQVWEIWKRRPTMRQMAELGYFVIRYIERFELNLSVGVSVGFPQIWYIPDNPPREMTEETKDNTIRQLDSASLVDMRSRIEKRLDDYKRSVERIWSA